MIDTKGVTAMTPPERPAVDPVPWLTAMWKANGCFATDFAKALTALGSERDQKVGAVAVYGKAYEDQAKQQAAARAAFSGTAEALAAVVQSVGSTVDALHSDPNPYRVSFGNISSAGTDHTGRNVLIGTRLLTLTSLTEGQRAAGLVGIALHETGHIEFSQPYGAAVKAHWANSPVLKQAYGLHNVGDDNRVERKQSLRFPALVPALDCAAALMGDLVLDQIAEQGGVAPFAADLTTAKGRDRALRMGSRYPWTVDWSTEAATKALTWIRAWAERMSEDHTPKEHVTLIEEALAWINDLPEGEDGGDEPCPEGEEPTDEPNDNPTKGEKPGEGPGGSQPTPSQDSDESESESEDEGGEGGDEGKGESEKPGEIPTDTKGGNDGGTPTTDTEGEDTDTEGGDHSETDSKPTEGETTQSGSPTDSPTEGDLNEIPEIPDCSTDAAHSQSEDELADEVTQAHEAARRDVKRMRRYPGATGGTVIVQEKRFGEPNSGVDFMSTLGDTVAEDDQDARRIAVDNQTLMHYGGDARGASTKDIPNNHAALAAVINSARRGPGMPERGQRSGRVDRGRLARVATSDPRVFTRQSSPAPQKVRVHILIDSSGSMGGGPDSRRAKAAQVGRDLAGAFDRLPWATARIYGFAEAGSSFVTRIWETGESRSKVDRFLLSPSGGTPLGYCVAYVADDLLEERHPSEKGVVIVISDGSPSYDGGITHVRSVVDYYRQRGLRVVSVAMASLGEAQQRMFGRDALAYEANMAIFARNMARVVGSSL